MGARISRNVKLMSWEVWKPEIGLIEDLRRFISELDQIAGSISRLAQNQADLLEVNLRPWVGSGAFLKTTQLRVR